MLRSNTHSMQWYFVGPPPAKGGRRPRTGAAASALCALAAAMRARPSTLHVKKALASKWYKRLFQQVGSLRKEGGLSYLWEQVGGKETSRDGLAWRL